ncbi:MAG: hypothetical protein ACRENX_10845 [Candidatus Dormibacteria bacterium]
MTILAIVAGVVLMLAVAAGLARARPIADYLPLLLSMGRGRRRWWLLAGATAVTLLVSLVAGLSSSESRPFTWLVALGVMVPLLLACGWAWGRARSFS